MILLPLPANITSAAEESCVTPPQTRAPPGPRDIQLGPRGNDLDDQVLAGRGEGADGDVREVAQLDSVCLAGRRWVRLAGERRGGTGRLGDHGIGVELHLAWSPRSHPEREWKACGEAVAWLGARGTHPPAQPSLLALTRYAAARQLVQQRGPLLKGRKGASGAKSGAPGANKEGPLFFSPGAPFRPKGQFE